MVKIRRSIDGEYRQFDSAVSWIYELVIGERVVDAEPPQELDLNRSTSSLRSSAKDVVVAVIEAPQRSKCGALLHKRA